MKLKGRLFSQVRLKQLANCLVLILSANILLESFSDNLLLASARKTRKFSQFSVSGQSQNPAIVSQLQNLTTVANSKNNNLKNNSPKSIIGVTCDPTVTNSCGNGLECDPNSKTCLISVSNSCLNNSNNCAAGLSCDASTHLCCAPIGGSCLGEIDCCVRNSSLSGVDSSAGCEPQNGQPITVATPGICKLLPQADCSQAPHDCILGAICGTSSLNTQQTCCINPVTGNVPATELNYTCQFDGDCCAGSICDSAADVNRCVVCLPAGHSCAGRTASCCTSANLVCDPTGICVTSSSSTACPLLGQSCQQFSDCGGYNCNLVCDQTTLTCQLCGRLGTTCIGINSCCPTALNGQLHCDIHNTKTCCVPQGAPCVLDTDCCADAAGPIECLAVPSAKTSALDINLATNKICTLTKIYSGQLCGASLNTTVEPTANASTPCVQDDLYNRPVTCNLEAASGGSNFSDYLCGISSEILIPAGQPCANLTTTIDGVVVTYNNCAGWDSNKDYAEAACLLVDNKLRTFNDSQVCCSLAGGACDSTHANNGNVDCCYSTLVCDPAFKQCKYSGSTPNTGPELLTAGATNGWEVAAIAILVIIVIIASYAGYKYYNRKKIIINKLIKKLNAAQGIIQLQQEDVDTLVAVYPKGFIAKGCDPHKRKTFIDTLVEVLSERMTNWDTLVQQSGITPEDFKANLSLLLELTVQQKAGETINLPGVTTAASAAVTQYFDNMLPDIMNSTLKSMGVPDFFISTVSSFTEPMAKRKFTGLQDKILRQISAKIGADTVMIDAAQTRQGLKALSDMVRGTINIINSDAENAAKNVNIIGKLSEAANFLELTISQMPEGLPDSDRGGVVNVDSPLNRAVTAVMAENLKTNIEANRAIQLLSPPDKPLNIMWIGQAFKYDPVDFAKIYIGILAQLMASEPVDDTITDDRMVEALKFYLPFLNPEAKLDKDPNVTFATILQDDSFRRALAVAGAAAMTDPSAIVPVFKSSSSKIPLSLKRLILKINGYANAETITQTAINSIDDLELENYLETAVPLLNQIIVTADDGNNYPLMDLDGRVELTTDFGELAGLAMVYA